MQLAQMKVKLCLALQLNLDELDVFLLPARKIPNDPLKECGYFGVVILRGNTKVRSILFKHLYELRLSTAINAIVSAPTNAWTKGDCVSEPLLLKQRRPRVLATGMK